MQVLPLYSGGISVAMRKYKANQMHDQLHQNAQKPYCLSQTRSKPRSEEPSRSITRARRGLFSNLTRKTQPGPLGRGAWCVMLDACAIVCARPDLSVARSAIVSTFLTHTGSVVGTGREVRVKLYPGCFQERRLDPAIQGSPFQRYHPDHRACRTAEK